MSEDEDMHGEETPEFRPDRSWLGAAEEAVVFAAEEQYTDLARHERGGWVHIEAMVRLAFIRGVNAQKYGPQKMLDGEGRWKANQ